MENNDMNQSKENGFEGEVQNDEFFVENSSIKNMKGNYLFTFGDVGSGKSTIHNMLIYSLWETPNIKFDYHSNDGKKLQPAIIVNWVKKISSGLLPERTQYGKIQDFSISFSQQKKKPLRVHFLEISGEDIKSIIPARNKTATLFHQIDSLLRSDLVKKRFIFVSDSSKHLLSNKEKNEDIMFSEIISLLKTQILKKKTRIKILFIVSKWDVLNGKYKSPVDYFNKNFPQMKSYLGENWDITYIPFSVGAVNKVETNKQDEFGNPVFENKIDFPDAGIKYAKYMIQWIHYSFTNEFLTGFPKIKETLLDKIKRLLGT